MISRKGVLVIAFIIAIVSFFFFWNFLIPFFDSAHLSPDEDGSIFQGCEAIEDSGERYDCYEDIAVESLRNGESLEVLLQVVTKDHLAEHAIGGATLIVSEYDLKKAAEMCLPNNCSGRYMHGVAIAWEEYAPLRINEYEQFLTSVCTSDSLCSHRFGHFYTDVYKYFDQSLELCDEFKDDFPFLDCVHGVVHERHIDSEIKDVLELCPNYKGRKRMACYTYSSQWYAVDPGGAKVSVSQIIDVDDKLMLCGEISEEVPNEFNRCYIGLGEFIRRATGEAPKLAWCKDLKGEFQKKCIEGFNVSSLSSFISSCDSEETSKEGGSGCSL